MQHLSRWNNDHPATRDPRALREIDARRIGCHRRVGSAEAEEQVPADQHAGPGDVGDVSHDVVLFLVAFVLIKAGVGNTENVCGGADQLQGLRAVGVQQLGADDRGVDPLEFFHHGTESVGTRRDIVVQNPDVGDLWAEELAQRGGCGHPGDASLLCQRHCHFPATHCNDHSRLVDLCRDRIERVGQCSGAHHDGRQY
ncbi:hypothetical protein BMS3Abin02_01414 [bacterium BMS3Abin02]|nr:hypothetical protein BMS3Abin02_01414 [bacterium BMS3Abin02]